MEPWSDNRFGFQVDCNTRRTLSVLPLLVPRVLFLGLDRMGDDGVAATLAVGAASNSGISDISLAD
jgi:hypothetical protein